MSFDPRIAKLRQVQELLSEVTLTLDASTVECPHCHRSHNTDTEQRTQYEILKSAYEKCGKVANWLERSNHEVPTS